MKPEQHTYQGDWIHWDMAALSKAIQNRQISPIEVTEKLLGKIQEENKHINAFITVTAEEALEQAKKAESEIHAGLIKGPLHGVPIALKDNIYMKNVKTTMGSAVFKDFSPDEHASVVEKLQKAGAVLVGKTNMHEIAFGTTGDLSFAGPVKNPYDPDKITGGSSSGSGAAVAAHLCYGALGTDTGGSVRIPASFTGIVGMKPTFGRVSNFGVFPLSWTLDHVGPMTRTVRDNALMLNVLAGYDNKDPYSVDQPTEDYTALIDSDIKGKVVGVPFNGYFSGGDKEVEENFQNAAQLLEQHGAEVKSVELPDMDTIVAAFRTTLTTEAYAVHEQNLRDYPSLWSDEIRERLNSSRETLAKDYIQAQQIKKRAIRDFENMFKEIDILVTPTIPILPFAIGEREIDVNGSVIHSSLLLNKYTGPFNITGLPSLSMTCGFSKDGLPIGLQLVGKSFDEANIYRFAAILEKYLKSLVQKGTIDE